MDRLSKSEFLKTVTFRPVTLDDLSSIRYVHMTSFRILGAEHHSPDEIQAHVDDMIHADYFEEILTCDLYCAQVEEEIVGTGGWCPADDSGSTARIRKVFVRPLFTNVGIGRTLVQLAENRAKMAGFENFSVRANINAVSFYEGLDFEISSYGVMPTRSGIDLPVAFMRKRRSDDPSNSKSKKMLTPVSRDGWWSH